MHVSIEVVPSCWTTLEGRFSARKPAIVSRFSLWCFSSVFSFRRSSCGIPVFSCGVLAENAPSESFRDILLFQRTVQETQFLPWWSENIPSEFLPTSFPVFLWVYLVGLFFSLRLRDSCEISCGNVCVSCKISCEQFLPLRFFFFGYAERSRRTPEPMCDELRLPPWREPPRTLSGGLERHQQTHRNKRDLEVFLRATPCVQFNSKTISYMDNAELIEKPCKDSDFKSCFHLIHEHAVTWHKTVTHGYAVAVSQTWLNACRVAQGGFDAPFLSCGLSPLTYDMTVTDTRFFFSEGHVSFSFWVFEKEWRGSSCGAVLVLRLVPCHSWPHPGGQL